MKFTLEEVLKSNGYSMDTVPQGALINLTRLIERINKIGYEPPMRCTSAYRSPEHNQRIGGAKNSPHTLGRAIDIYDPDGELKNFLMNSDILERLNLRMEHPLDTPTWCHIDNMPVKTNRIFRA